MRLRILVTAGLVSLITMLVTAQGPSCPEIIYEAILTVNEVCTDTERNEVCYGSSNIEAQPRPEASIDFDAPGDIATLSAIQAIHTLPLNVDNQEFGVALMRAQADIPNSIPGQSVTFLLMGDVQMMDNSEAVESAQPMQAFVFSPGIGQSRCEGVDYDTLAIKTPENMTVSLNINGVDVELGSTAVLVGTPQNEMDLLIVEGEGVVTANGGTQTVPAGQWTQVQLGGESGLEAVGTPAEPTDFPPERIAHIPFEVMDAGRNVAFQKPTTSSNELPTDPSSNVVSGIVTGGNNWNSGPARGSQWVQIDLEREYTVQEIRFMTSQFPEDEFFYTVNELYVAGEDGNLRRVFTFEGETLDDQWISFRPAFPLQGVRYVRLWKISPPEDEAWASYEEIEVIAAGVSACRVTPDGSVNLRQAPGTDSDVVGLFPAGEFARVNGQTVGVDGFTWWRLEEGAWVRSDVVAPAGACERVPVVSGE